MSQSWIVAFAMLWLLVILLAVVVLGLLRRVAPLLVRLDHSLGQPSLDMEIGGLPVGEKVPAFEVSDDKGEKVQLDDTLPAVFLFVDSTCEPCRKLIRELEEQAAVFSGTRLYVVSENSSEYAGLRKRGLKILQQDQGQASEAFQQDSFPQAFAVDGQRRVASSAVTDSLEDIKQLASQVGADELPSRAIAQPDQTTYRAT